LQGQGEEDVSDVVEKLAGFLQEQDISVAEDEDTADLINKISEQISKMLDDQKTSHPSEYSV
jgi:agmatine/peptidylarginine deiminase